MYFWKQWTFTVLSTVAVIAAQYNFNIFEFILENDPTFITLGIIGLFAVVTVYVNYLAFQKQFNNITPENYIMNPMWFSADALMSIGMVGTLMGFLIVLTSAFGGIDTANTEQLKEVIAVLARGMGVALLTSLAGLITSTALKAQLLILNPAGEV